MPTASQDEAKKAAAKVTGVIQHLTANMVRGWAAIKDDPEPVEVIVAVNGTEIGRVRAVEFREAVKRNNLHPTGLCGFVVRLKGQQLLSHGDLVSVTLADTGQHIRNSPMRCELNVVDGETTLVAEPTGSSPQADESVPLVIDVPNFPRPPARGPWKIFADSFMAFFLRELRNRFGKSRYGYAWALVQPIAFMLLISSARGIVRGRHLIGEGNLILGVEHRYYIWCGLIPFFMFSHGFSQGLGATGAFRGLFNYRQVQPLDLIVVKLVIEFLSMMVVFIILTTGFWWFGIEISVDNVVGWLAVIVLLFCFTLGAVLMAEAAVAANPDVKTILSFIDRPLLFISGTFYTIATLSPRLKPYLIWNPLLHATDIARGEMLAKYDPLGSWAYLSLWSLFFLLAGLGLYRRKRAELSAQ